MKLTRILLLFVLVFAGSVSAADLNVVTANANDAFDTMLKSKSAGTGTFSDFVLTVEDSTAGHTSPYTAAFTVSAGKWLAYRLDGFVFAFPDGFDLTNLTVSALSDNNPCVSFRVTDVRITGQTVAIELRRTWDREGDEKRASAISFALTMDDIGNTDQAGTYQLAGLAFDRSNDILAGPTLSQPFHILPGGISDLQVDPDTSLALVAGDFLTFTAAIVDEFGNRIEDITPTWSLSSDSDPIGRLVGGTFQATTVGTGRVTATYGDLTATSGLITVTPGQLSRIDLTISHSQLVGRPLSAPATVTFRDANGNLKTDLDLNNTPLHLLVDGGELSPDNISDNNLLINGSIDLAALGITCLGPTAVTNVTATVGWLVSNEVEVSFSGYDILAILNVSGEPLSVIPSGVETNILVVVQNNGQLSPFDKVTLIGAYETISESDTVRFTGSSYGATDTVWLHMPAHDMTTTEDIFAATLRAPFRLAGQDYVTVDSESIPVSVEAISQLQIVSDKIGPDTVYPGALFQVGFAVDPGEVPQPFLAGSALIEIVTPATAEGRRVYYGSVGVPVDSNGLIAYHMYGARLFESDALPSGDFVYRISARIKASDGLYYNAEAEVNPVTVLAPVSLTYVSGSLSPTAVAAGLATSFAFDMNLDNDYPVAFDGTASLLTVTGPGFLGSSSLIGPDSLYPGPNRVRSQELFIPQSLRDQSLTLAGRLDISVPTATDPVSVTTNFDSVVIPVTEQAVARIIDLRIVAPNAPMVNTSQPFQAKCLVANLSNTSIAPFSLRLESNGGSTFDTLKTTSPIPPHDTIEVFFDCVAAAMPNSAEIFRVSMAQSTLEYLEPINNLALVTIQTPADLTITYTLFGAPGGLVDQNVGFGLTVEIVNSGQADATDGVYLLTTDGVEFATDDSLTGPITVGRHVEFQFVSPPFDTIAEFVFRLTDLPLDRNTGEPARIDTISFVIPIRVESQDADLLVEAVPLGSNLVSPGQTKDLFRLSLTNRGISTITSIRLEEIAVALLGRDNQPLPVAQFFDPTGTFVTEDGVEVSTTVSVRNKLMIEFSNFQIPSGATRSIVLTGAFTDNMTGEFTLSFETGDILAVFSGGNQDGRQVRVSSSTGSPFLLSRPYVVRGHSLSESFVIEDNPFNPELNPARFSYELTEPSSIEFRVFTLTGEEVLARDIPEAAAGAAGSEKELTWDGRNGSGDMVANGVYIVSIKIVRTGEVARMKAAVVK